MKSSSRHLLLGLVGLLFGSFSLDAAASMTFPEALRKRLDLATIPNPPLGCQLCHQTDQGGLRTATKPIGRSLLKDGATGGSVPSLLAALSSLESDGTDSDADGTSDIAELRAGTDPNVNSSGMPPDTEQIPLPETGCTLTRAPSSQTFASVLLLGVAFWLRIRRRLRHTVTRQR